MDSLPLLQSKADILRYFESMPASLQESGSPDRCFTPAQARHFFAALHANGMSILGFEIWRKSDERYELDVEGIWHSHGSDARWNHADAVGFLRIAAPSFGDLVTIQFADANG